MSGPATLTVEQLAELLGCHPWTLRQMVIRGTSPVPPIHLGRRVVFARAAVDRLLGTDAEGLDEHRQPVSR